MSHVEDPLTERVIQCVIRVHQTLGPGFLESICRNALILELKKHELKFETEKDVTAMYDGHLVGMHRLDLVVEGQIVVELKTVESRHRAHYAQVRSYLKASGLRVGLLVNFAAERADFRRIEI
jgi:GxxExxY protein